MRGHIRKRVRSTSSGKSIRYHPIVYRGRDPVTGKKKYSEGRGYNTKKEAEAALNKALMEIQTGNFVSASSVTLSEYVTTSWLPTTKARVKPSTYRVYESSAARYILPLIGSLRLQEITTAHLNTAYARLLTGDLPVNPRRTRREPLKPERLDAESAKPYRQRSNRPLSAKTVYNVHAQISKILADAVDEGLLQRSPATRAKPPRPTKPEITTWTPGELDGFLRMVEPDRLYGLWHLAAMTGMRRGELLGLMWQDIDLERGRLSVRRNLVRSADRQLVFTTPKNHQARTIDLDQETTSVLKTHRARIAEERLRFGAAYESTDLVFPREDGQPSSPDSISKRFVRLCSAALAEGIAERRLTMHGLRHTHATLALAAGLPVKVIAERLGHSSPAFTMSVYQHVLPSMQREAADLIAEIVRRSSRQEDDARAE